MQNPILCYPHGAAPFGKLFLISSCLKSSFSSHLYGLLERGLYSWGMPACSRKNCKNLSVLLHVEGMHQASGRKQSHPGDCVWFSRVHRWPHGSGSPFVSVSAHLYRHRPGEPGDDRVPALNSTSPCIISWAIWLLQTSAPLPSSSPRCWLTLCQRRRALPTLDVQPRCSFLISWASCWL